MNRTCVFYNHISKSLLKFFKTFKLEAIKVIVSFYNVSTRIQHVHKPLLQKLFIACAVKFVLVQVRQYWDYF